MAGGSGVTEDVLDDIAFLVRSVNRVRILSLLTGTSYSRGEIEETTGIARTTIDRTINEFEDRGWVQRTSDGGYAATPTGECVISEFEPFAESMEAIHSLGDLVDWLPTDTAPVELHHFSDVTIRRPEQADPASTMSYVTELLREAGEFQCLVGIAPPIAFEEAMRDRVVDRDMETTHVITTEEYEYLLDHEDRVSRWREYVEGGANLYRYDGTVPCNFLVFDETVIIGHTQGKVGESFVEIESKNEAVREWAVDLICEYRDEAERLDAAAFR